MLNKVFLFLFIIINLISCKESNKNKAEKIDSVQLTKQELEYIKKMEEKKNQVYDFSNNLKPEEILEFLPKNIIGFETLPNTMGTQSDDSGKLYTFAKGQYSNENKQSIIIDIFDYGRGNEPPNKKIYDLPPDDLEAITTKYTNKYAKGFYLYDEKLNYARLEVMVNNRFVVIVRFNRPNGNPEFVKEIINKVNLKKLKEVK